MYLSHQEKRCCILMINILYIVKPPVSQDQPVVCYPLKAINFFFFVFASSLMRPCTIFVSTPLSHFAWDGMTLIMRKPVYAICEKVAGKPARPRSLISIFVVHLLDSIASILSNSKVSRL